MTTEIEDLKAALLLTHEMAQAAHINSQNPIIPTTVLEAAVQAEVARQLAGVVAQAVETAMAPIRMALEAQMKK